MPRTVSSMVSFLLLSVWRNKNLSAIPLLSLPSLHLLSLTVLLSPLLRSRLSYYAPRLSVDISPPPPLPRVDQCSGGGEGSVVFADGMRQTAEEAHQHGWHWCPILITQPLDHRTFPRREPPPPHRLCLSPARDRSAVLVHEDLKIALAEGWVHLAGESVRGRAREGSSPAREPLGA